MVLLWCLPQTTLRHLQNEMEQKVFCSMLLLASSRLIRMESLVAADASSSHLSDVWEASRCLSPSSAALWVRQLILLQCSYLLSKQHYFKVTLLKPRRWISISGTCFFHIGLWLCFKYHCSPMFPSFSELLSEFQRGSFSSTLRDLWLTFSTLTLVLLPALFFVFLQIWNSRCLNTWPCI